MFAYYLPSLRVKYSWLGLTGLRCAIDELRQPNHFEFFGGAIAVARTAELASSRCAYVVGFLAEIASLPTKVCSICFSCKGSRVARQSGSIIIGVQD